MPIDPTLYRQVLGHFPTGVTVITAMCDDEPTGLTIGSFTSVSLDPPLVGFLAQTDSERWARMSPVGSFCVNVLAPDHAELCWQFAKKSVERPFDGVTWEPSPVTGSPMIDGAIAWMDCTTEAILEAGDHVMVLGRLVALE
ncbi:MAG TPA: flavin reductase family protein, partial [Ilumatobacteraceae bacterium]|nr:flavin reductase family protein [Ilumatobacteraceae bacterium]